MSLRDRFRLPGPRATRSPRRRLFTKYLVVLVGLVGSTVLVTSLVTLYFTYRDTEAAAARLLEETALQQAHTLSNAGLQAALEVSEAAPDTTPGEPPPTLADRGLSYSRHIGRIRELIYVDRNGRARIRVDAAGPSFAMAGRDLSGVPAVELALANAQWGPREAFGPATYPEGLVPRLQIAVSEAGDPGGATLAELDIVPMVGDQFFYSGNDVVLTLVDSRGRELASPRMLKQIQTGALPDFPDRSTLPQIAAAIAGAAPGPGPVLGFWQADDVPAPRQASWEHDAEGHAVLSASAPVLGPGWQVIAEERRGDVLAPVYSAAVRTVIFLVVFLGLAVLASALLARRMVRPITQIESGARRIGEGALDERIEVRTGDELQSLSETFNLMATQLGDLYADLERRVEDRTKQLSAALEQNAALLGRLEAKGRDLEAASRHKSEFLATMSHELRTPLNAIIGFSEVLQERMFGELNERQAEYLEDIHVSGRHLLALIDDVLDLAKIEAGRMDLDIGEVDVGECLVTGLAMVRERAARGGVRLSTELDPAFGPIPADGRRLKQVILNLLANAVKFTPEGGRVEASARLGDGEVLIAVRDTGPGIEPGDQERIFETFRQAGDRAGQEGSGLGLPLSRALVELHGGRLWVESRLGEGSTFILALPLVATAARR